MNKVVEIAAKQPTATTLFLYALIAVYASSRVLQVFPGKVPMLAIVALHVLPPLVFALIHGAMVYGVRGIVTFFALCFVVGTIVENFGVLTGFPFGHYYFTEVMGPKIFHVPIFLGLAYVGMGYLSWILGRVILGGSQSALGGSRVVTLPLIAAFLMVAWDLCLDPVWATVVHAWIWQQGGAYFGVPVSNFLGWYLHVYILYQLFALYLRGRPTNASPLPSGYWRLAVLFYGVSAAGNLLLLIPRPGLSQVTDATGKEWQVSSITAACALASIFTMGAFALLAWIRLTDRDSHSDPVRS
jgi:uncharacterized membrane protein